MNNAKIRTALVLNNVYIWELAEMLDVSDNVLYKMLRHEIHTDVQDQVVKVIECAVAGEPYDNKFFRLYRATQDKRHRPHPRTPENYARYVAKCLDEAERRRIEGGWDLSI